MRVARVKYHRVYQEPPAISDSGIKHPAFPSNDSKHPSQDGSQQFWSPGEVNPPRVLKSRRNQLRVYESDKLFQNSFRFFVRKSLNRWRPRGWRWSHLQLWSSEEFISTNQINLTSAFIAGKLFGRGLVEGSSHGKGGNLTIVFIVGKVAVWNWINLSVKRYCSDPSTPGEIECD